MAKTNSQLELFIDANITTNNSNDITGAKLNDVLMEMNKRNTLRVEMDLILGENAVDNPYESMPSNVQVWQRASSKTFLLAAAFDIYTKDSDETTKFYINSTSALANCIITFNV